MLKNIDPLLNADLLHALQSMGHGDVLAIVDTNFPSDSVGRETVVGQALTIAAPTAARAAEAILSVFPLDTFIPEPARRMEVVGSPDERPAVQQEFQAAIDKWEGPQFKLGNVERYAFYEEAKRAYAVVQTGERRFYGCFLLTKGVIPPEG
ncbi:RbsD/FucU family protein [Oryzibacter oryziterrae]|uniref:RbsD/FucU family protein n=1 Tax=Oryzibacter oryziterrae TaxID=2766474 RepID=UPI001F2746DA|nr:RbsD/FucU domain-containing protein [Oryzibacter oryziterrae]